MHPGRTRYLVVVSCTGRQDAEESCLLGIDCHARATVGLVLRVLADTAITLDGDGYVRLFSYLTDPPYLLLSFCPSLQSSRYASPVQPLFILEPPTQGPYFLVEESLRNKNSKQVSASIWRYSQRSISRGGPIRWPRSPDLTAIGFLLVGSVTRRISAKNL